MSFPETQRGAKMRKEDRLIKQNTGSKKSGRRSSPRDSSHHKAIAQATGAFPRASGAFPYASDSCDMPTKKLDEPIRVVVTNNQTPSKTKASDKKGMPATPEKQRRNRPKPHTKSNQKRTLYHSPESIKLRVPGSSRTEPTSPPSLFHSPEKLWKALRCTPPPCRSRDKENSWAGSWMDQAPFRCGNTSSCGASSATPSDVSASAFTTRLTPDTLQQHDSMIGRSPDRAPKFSGDKLAATVITKKTKLQLEKEQIEKAQEELELFVYTNVIPALPPQIEDARRKHWIEMERQRVLQQKWQRKKQEQMVRTRAEQLRQAELERQRKLQVSPSTPIKKRPTLSRRDASPSTPRTHHLATRKMIEI